MLPADSPKRGQIWFTKLPTDPPDKSPRPVIIVSPDWRNQHPRSTTVMVVPLTTSLPSANRLAIKLTPGETGLRDPSSAAAESVSVVFKSTLYPPHAPLRTLSNARICELSRLVAVAMGCG